MKIVMLKNIWRSGQIELASGKTYSAPKDLSLDFANALINAGKAVKKEEPKKKKNSD
jgi:hypothetical protein